MASDQVARFRTAVDDERRGDDLEKRLAASAPTASRSRGETLKTRPRGVDPDHPRLELLRHKSPLRLAPLAPGRRAARARAR